MINKSDKRHNIRDGKHLIVRRNLLTKDHPRHWHSYFEVEIVLSGKGGFILNDTKYDFSEYNVFLLSPTDFHSIYVEDEVRILNLSFDEEYISESHLVELIFTQTDKAYQFEPDELERLVMAVELLYNEVKINGDCQAALLKYAIACITRKNSNHSISSIAEHYSGIMKAIVYMKVHFSEQITLAALAEQAGYNPTYFSELFKKVTGESYIEALNKLRVGYARSLLASGYSVNDACFTSGFGSLSNFGTVFKKHCGMSPSEYKSSSK
ncbi:MAG: helix-turn-helix domain-containing protein [Clostridia bacterium]|nr:helix-turn-helix domain-containing protein [Clostridia bacterium]